ncbi:MAG TPA: YggS family pyridoxal phosphate-dependent enzyme, partial [Gemmatimonadales bacterium]
MDFPGLPDRLAAVRETVAQRQALGGWRHPVRIVAVTKTHGPEAVRAALAAGLEDIGENRVQEALQKQEAVSDVVPRWHLIGTLQRNKARHAAGRFALIHSVDRTDLALELDRRVPTGARQAVLVQVNCSDESQKGGVMPDGLAALLDELRALERIEVRGLMTMSALTEDPDEQRRAFRLLRELRDEAERSGHSLPE